MLLFSAFEIGLLNERFQRFQEKILSAGYIQLVIIFIRTENIKAFKLSKQLSQIILLKLRLLQGAISNKVLPKLPKVALSEVALAK